MANPRLLVVSNRLPVTAALEGDRLTLVPSAGGLARGLRGPHEDSDGLWIGWPGELDDLAPAQEARLASELEQRRLLPVGLSAEEVRRYYEAFANGVIWPLFHYLLDRVPLNASEWGAYRAVNQRFADAVVRAYRPGDIVWVHDYQLMLVPELVRQALPTARIGFFLHIPFPALEAYRILPWRLEIVQGLLGADLIGFHTAGYARHFRQSVRYLLDLEFDDEDAPYRGRRIRIGAFPMGVDVAAFERLAASDEVRARVAALRQEAGGRRLLLGVDRLDYTKGIPRRLLAFEMLLKRHPGWNDHVRFIQVAVPSRTGVELYKRFRATVEELVGRINGLQSSVSNVPVHYLNRSLDQEELVALYCAADVMLVTPLRDGMNLVAKEFVASRSQDDGVLVLSEFAGAADELGEALLVNPYDVEGVARTIERALAMSPAERAARMRRLRQRVRGNTVRHWTNRFLDELAQVTARSAAPEFIRLDGSLAPLIDSLARAQHVVLLLDYDGTLVPLAQAPELSPPDPELLELLRALGRHARYSVHIVSGRQRETLATWFGDLPLTLWAQHGFWRRPAGAADWTAAFDVDVSWQARASEVLEQVTRQTAGSMIEFKGESIAWHYRASDPVRGRERARWLQEQVARLFPGGEVEAISGSKVIEIRPRGMHKGLAVQVLIAEMPGESRFLALGDDRTDEDMFAALPPDGFAIQVGLGPSRARYRLSSPAAVREFLSLLVKADLTNPDAPVQVAEPGARRRAR